MKKIHIIFAVYIFVGVILFNVINMVSPVNIHGYYKTLEYARQSTDIYDNSQIIHTEICNDKTVDFVIDEDNKIHIITIRYDKNGNNKRYQKHVDTGYPINEIIHVAISQFQETREIPWENAHTTTFVQSQYEPLYWTILPVSIQVHDQFSERYEFIFNNESYYLYINP